MTEWSIYASVNLAIIGSNNGLSKLLQKPLLIYCHRVKYISSCLLKTRIHFSLPHVLNCVHDSLTLQRSYGMDFTSNCCFSGLGDYFAGRNQVGSIVLFMIGLSLVAMVMMVILENLDNYISRDPFGNRPYTPESEEKEERTVPNHGHLEQDKEHLDTKGKGEIGENLKHDEMTCITKMSTGRFQHDSSILTLHFETKMYVSFWWHSVPAFAGSCHFNNFR